MGLVGYCSPLEVEVLFVRQWSVVCGLWYVMHTGLARMDVFLVQS